MGALMRSRTDRRIAGICGGLARQYGWDATIVRLIWVALVIFGGTGLLVYLIMWIVVPEEPYALPAQAGYPPSAVGYGQPTSAYAPPVNYGAPAPPPQTHSGAPVYPGQPPQAPATPRDV